MKSKKTSSPTSPSKPTSREAAVPPVEIRPQPPPTREQIQALAHAIWKDRGCPPDADVEIWLEAERQLTGGTKATPGVKKVLASDESIDPDRSDAARIDREMDRLVRPSEQRSPTSL